MINPDKIKDVIGPGGKMIHKIIEMTGVKIDIEDDGRVFIVTPDAEAAQKAKGIIEDITREVEVGKVYHGRVTRLMNFGAFVEIFPGKEGLVHISQIGPGRVERVEDVLSVGDEIDVKVLKIDEQGRVNLTKKGVDGNEDDSSSEQQGDGRSSFRGGGRHDRDRNREHDRDRHRSRRPAHR